MTLLVFNKKIINLNRTAGQFVVYLRDSDKIRIRLKERTDATTGKEACHRRILGEEKGGQWPLNYGDWASGRLHRRARKLNEVFQRRTRKQYRWH